MATTKLSVFALLLLIVMIVWIKNPSVYLNKNIGEMTVANQVGVRETQDVCKWRTVLEDKSVLSIYFSDLNIGVVGGAEEQFWITNDGGKNWFAKSIARIKSDKRKGQYDLIKAVIQAPNKIYFIGHYEEVGSAIFSSIDNGKTWDVQYYDGISLNDIASLSSKLWIVGHTSSANTNLNSEIKSVLLYASDSGVFQKLWESNYKEVFFSVFFTSSNDGWLAGADGLIKSTVDGGRTWKNIKSPTKNTLESIAFRNLNEGYAIGQRGTFLQTSDGGNTWLASRISSNIPIHNNYQSLAITKSGEVWVGGMLGRVLFTRNKGADWEPIVGFPIEGGAYDIFAIENRVWVATGDDRLLVCEQSHH